MLIVDYLDDKLKEMCELKPENRITVLGIPILILPFVGENLTLEEFKLLNEEQKIHLISQVNEENKDWLQKKFKELNAVWLTVIDGKVVTSSPDIDEYPDEAEILALCEKNEQKFPFIFVNQNLFQIEEGFSMWNPTTLRNDDYYPTVEIKIKQSESTQGILRTADFDTGASEIFLDMELLISKGLISPPSPVEQQLSLQHLGRTYSAYIKTLFIEIVSKDDKRKQEKFSVVCVKDWEKSPFLKINSYRSALVGRRLFQKMQACVELDFISRETRFSW